ncbi:MAG TPA: autotransporter-associated beta strand repeat-containing protein, partial [Verrucomicrobiae bacterium]|nr:autotransporter-associated beta strand repeat-containing protein [Verrucomicrobiae bacterium]
MKIKQTILKQITLCAGLLVLAQAATVLQAASGKDTWTGGAGTANWADAANWTGANTPPAPGDIPTFGAVGTGGATLNNNLAALTSFAGMTFNSGAPSFILNGNSIDSTGGIADNSLNLQTVNLALQFTVTHSISATAGGTMVIGGVISAAGGATKTGVGTVTLTGANTYTGTTTVSAGILNLDFNAAGAPSANIVKSTSPLALGGGTLNLNGNTAAGSAQTFASTVLTGGNGITVTAPSGQTDTLTLGAISQTAVGATLAVLPSGAGTATVAGSAGTAVSAAANTPILGATAGFLSGAMVTYGLNDYAMISGGNLVALGSTPANYTANAGPNADVTGGGYTVPSSTTSINVMRFNTAGASTVVNRTVYTTGGVLVTPNVGANNQTITSSGSTHALEPNRSTTSGSESVIWQNNLTGYLVFAGANFLDNGKTGAATWVQAGPGTVQYNQTAATAATFTGSMYLNGGYTLVTANGNAVFGAQATAATLNLNGGTVVADSVFALDNAGANLRPVAILNAGGGLAATAGNSILIDGPISGAAGTGALTIGIPASSANTNVIGLVPGSGAGTANSTPALATGTVLLSGTNTYTGNTIISSGTLMLTNNGSISNTASITVAGGAGFDVSALPAGYTLGGTQILAGSGTNNGSITTASGTIIYAGTDGVYGTNTFNNNLTNLSGALIYMDVGTAYNGANDFISVGGTLAMSGTTFHLKAPSTAVSLDTTHDYVLITAAGIAGTPNSTPVWDVQPVNAANFIMAVSGNSVVLRYSASAPPSGSGIATPGTVNRNQSALITVTATAGSKPINTVVLDASLLGGSSATTLTRSNTSSLYTNTVVVGAAQAPGVYSLPVTITDTSSPTPLSSVVNISLTVVNSQTWNGVGVNANWSTGANWVSGVSPVTSDFVTFAGSTQLAPSMDANYNLAGLAFNSTAGSFVLGSPSSVLTLSANGITNNSANTETVNTPLALTTAETFSAAAGNLVLGQQVDTGGNLVSFDGARTNIVNGAIIGAGGLTKNGAGTNILTGLNTYAGTTTVNAGVMQLNSGGAINCLAVNLTANASSQLQVINGSVTSTNLANVGQTCSLLVSSGTANFPGGIQTDVTTSAINADLISVFGGTLNASSITLGRTGLGLTTQPTTGNTANGLYVNGGTVNLSSNLNVTTIANGNANSTVNARVDSGTLNVGGALIIGLNNGGRWSDFDVTGGTVTVNDPTLGLSIGGPFAGNAVFLMRGGTVTTPLVGLGYGSIADTVVLSQSGGSLYVGSGGIQKVSSAATASVVWSGGTLGATADWSSTMPITVSGAVTLKAADVANVAHNIVLNGVLSGSGALTKTGNGVLSIGAQNTYSGLTAINAGSLQLTNDSVTLNGTVVGSISVASNAFFDVTGLSVIGGFSLGSAKTISGTGIIAGQFAAVDGSTVSPAGTGAEGQLSFTNGLTVQNMTFKMELTSDPTGNTLVNDSVSITGDFTANGTSTIAVA